MLVDVLTFNVKGTTFKNEENEDIQKCIKGVLKEYKENDCIDKEELYGGNSAKDIKEYDMNVSEYEGISFGGKIELSMFKNEPAFKVYISTYDGFDEFFPHRKEEKSIGSYKHIGYVPKEYINEILKYWNDSEITEYYVSISIVGGKYKHCGMDDYGNDKIETAELTYGFQVTLAFHNNIVLEKEVSQIELEKKDNSYNTLNNSTKQNSNNSSNDNFNTVIIIIMHLIFGALIIIPLFLFVRFFMWLF